MSSRHAYIHKLVQNNKHYHLSSQIFNKFKKMNEKKNSTPLTEKKLPKLPPRIDTPPKQCVQPVPEEKKIIRQEEIAPLTRIDTPLRPLALSPPIRVRIVNSAPIVNATQCSIPIKHLSESKVSEVKVIEGKCDTNTAELNTEPGETRELGDSKESCARNNNIISTAIKTDRVIASSIQAGSVEATDVDVINEVKAKKINADVIIADRIVARDIISKSINCERVQVSELISTPARIDINERKINSENNESINNDDEHKHSASMIDECKRSSSPDKTYPTYQADIQDIDLMATDDDNEYKPKTDGGINVNIILCTDDHCCCSIM